MPRLDLGGALEGTKESRTKVRALPPLLAPTNTEVCALPMGGGHTTLSCVVAADGLMMSTRRIHTMPLPGIDGRLDGDAPAAARTPAAVPFAHGTGRVEPTAAFFQRTCDE